MNIDFHYYATFAAARIAGYDAEQARTIAHAAQYVDESDDSLLFHDSDDAPAPVPYITDFEPVATMQSMTDQAYIDLMPGHWNESTLTATFRTWVPFHFLPGNYGATPEKKTYGGPRRHEGNALTGQFWEYTAEEQEQFKLLCLPNSELAAEMVNDIVRNHKGKPHELHLLGLRMHVLADTWAHMHHAGIMAWFINNAADEVVEVMPDGSRRALSWDVVSNLSKGLKDDPSSTHLAPPEMLYYNSVVYLGHGRMGHLPDFPYMSYEYQPQWAERPIVKSAYENFVKAFKQLVEAMRCVREGRLFAVENYADLGEGNEAVVTEILHTREVDQCAVWRANMRRIRVDGVALETPPAFERERWFEEMKRAGAPQGTDYYHFNLAAARQLELVTRALNDEGIYLLNPSRERNRTRVHLKDGDGRYIGAMEEAANLKTLSTQYYPTLGKRPVALEILSTSEPPLRSGDIVTIKTSEGGVGEYNFLGAWATPSLYYYTRDWDYNKQRWVVEKVGGSVGDPVQSGDRVRIRNRFYQQNSFLAPKGGYLTTRAQEAEWTLEVVD